MAARRTQKCGAKEAAIRLSHAQKFLEVAELVTEDGISESASVAAALAVLAGIAASDAACCRGLGRRSRSDDHHDAVDLLAQLHPGGHDSSNFLRRLLDLKDTAHYGLIHVSQASLKTALRQATHLVAFARDVLKR